MLREFPKLFQDPKIKYPSLSTQLSFTDYISEWKNIIASHRQDLGHNPEKIIQANAPFEIRPELGPKTGILLIHGLLDSSFIMKELAQNLASPELLIRSLLLPGHGTVPGALLNINHQEWLKTVRYGMDSLAQEVDKIFIIGFSTGALAAISETLQNDNKIAGIISFAPAFKIKSPFAGLSSWLPRFGKPWMGISEEIDYVKYSSITYQSVAQVYELGKQVRKTLQTKKLTCPSLMIASGNDEIISSAACMDFFRSDSNPKNRMIYYATPVNKLDDERISVRDSCYPEQRILNFSHICLTTSSHNHHYGKNGDFALASHIDLDTDTYFSGINTLDTRIYNKLYQWKLSKHKHKRLTFNPDFDFVVKKIKEFIQDDFL